jgi:predicted PolB exonuclease-like 3'-5' exonuclease
MNKNLPIKILHFDFETIPSGFIDDIVVKVPKTFKKEEAIEKYIEENREEQFRKRSVNTSTADLVAASIAAGDGEILSFSVNPDKNLTEKELLEDFSEYVLEEAVTSDEEGTIKYAIYWCGFNIRDFDLNILFKKAIKYKLYDLAKLVPRGSYDKRVIDLRELWTGTRQNDPKGGNKMKDVREYLGLEGKTAGMDGSMVYDYYLEGRIEEISHYCDCDVEEEREIFKLLEPGISLW